MNIYDLPLMNIYDNLSWKSLTRNKIFMEKGHAFRMLQNKKILKSETRDDTFTAKNLNTYFFFLLPLCSVQAKLWTFQLQVSTVFVSFLKVKFCLEITLDTASDLMGETSCYKCVYFSLF